MYCHCLTELFPKIVTYVFFMIWTFHSYGIQLRLSVFSKTFNMIFLVSAFLKRGVDYSRGFSSVLFIDTPEVAEIGLPIGQQNFKLCLLAKGNEPK